MFYKIKQIYYYIRYSIPHGIRNLIVWFCIIWNDRNWDNTFIYKILQHKLIQQEKCIRCGISLNAYKDADKIKLCVLLLDRLIKDNYHKIVYKQHDKKWGKARFVWEDYDEHNNILDISRPNVITEKDKKRERKEFLNLMGHEQYLINQDLSYLFHIMEKHIQGWWD